MCPSLLSTRISQISKDKRNITSAFISEPNESVEWTENCFIFYSLLILQVKSREDVIGELKNDTDLLHQQHKELLSKVRIKKPPEFNLASVSLQQTWKTRCQTLIFIIFNIFIFSFCPISSLQKFVYQNMEQETIFRSFAGLRFPWCWRSWCSENLPAAGNRQKKIVLLAILIHSKRCSQFSYTDFLQRCLERETRMKKTTPLKIFWLANIRIKQEVYVMG